MIHQRDYIHKQAIKNHDQTLFDQYRHLRNKVTSSVRQAKKEFYTSSITECKNDSKLMWKLLNNMIPKKCNSNNTVSSSLNPELFNKYFASIDERLTNHFDALVYPQLDNEEVSSFEFLEINMNEVLQHLLNLGNKSSLDMIDMDNKLLRLASPIIAPLLCHIFNLSLCNSIVPSDWKLARVTPIYKGQGEITHPGNYRPISVIPTVAKVLEKLVKRQLVSHFSNNDLISDTQFAYLKNRSTSTALHCLVDNLLLNINNHLINGISQIDISKEFDTINIDILKYKLIKYGIINTSWFESYFEDRAQQVFYNNKLSEREILTMGVPQGTVLGPIFFLIYTNDLSKNISCGKTISYADDTTLIVTGSNIDDVRNNLDTSLKDCVEWFNNNRLVINTSKTNTMVITNNVQLRNLENNPLVMIDDKYIPRVPELKILGILIDESLSWNAHIK